MKSAPDMTERRKHRRARLDLEAVIRPLRGDTLGQPIVCDIRDVSLAGIYGLVKEPVPFQLNDEVLCMVSVPRDLTRMFPFNRLHSKGWIVRIESTGIPMSDRSEVGGSWLGVAVTFAPNPIALAAFD